MQGTSFTSLLIQPRTFADGTVVSAFVEPLSALGIDPVSSWFLRVNSDLVTSWFLHMI
jgi:hypothetical protein